MTDLSNSKGRTFEEEIETILGALRNNHPERVRINKQIRLVLYDEQEVRPDYELQYDLLTCESRHLIECQDRERSEPQIAQKIKYVKGLSSRNRFIFVYRDNLSDTTRNALEKDGVLHMSLEEFAAWIAKLDVMLRLTEVGPLKGLIDELSFGEYLSRDIDDYETHGE